MKLIGIAGFAGSGKTTMASLMMGRLHKDCLMGVFPFAQPIKQTLAGLFNEDIQLWESQKTKNNLVTGHTFTRREAMRTFGTEWGRSLEPDLWIRIHATTISPYTSHTNFCIVVPDVRFISEAEYILDQGGEIIEILSNDTKAGEHESEHGLPARYIKHRIFNDKNKPFDNLIKQVDDLIPLLL